MTIDMNLSPHRTGDRPARRSTLHPNPSRRTARRGLLAAATAACVMVGLVSPASSAGDPVAQAQARLAAATADRVAADATVAEVRDRLAQSTERLAALDSAGAQLTEELTAARRELREFAIAAYIDGGQAAVFRSSLDPEKAQALAWQASLSLEQSTSAGDAADRFADLKRSNEPEQVAAAEQLDQLRVELQAAEFDQIQAAAFERDAESALAEAVAAREAARARAEQERAAAARRAADAAPAPAPAGAARATAPRSNAGSGGGGAAPAAPSGAMGNPTAAESATLARIRQCESRGNYSIVSSTGRYRGAYQFDVTTWRAVGGTGDPAAASPQEQDYRALLLLRMRGTRPWPHCGR